MFIEFEVCIGRGDVARDANVTLIAPPGFAFLNSPKGPRLSKKEYANYVCTQLGCGDIKSPIARCKKVNLKVPSQPNNYDLIYRAYCEGFDSNYQEFEVIVE